MECPECKKQISDKSPSCPGCGRPNYKPRSKALPLFGLLCLIVYLVIQFKPSSSNQRVIVPSQSLQPEQIDQVKVALPTPNTGSISSVSKPKWQISKTLHPMTGVSQHTVSSHAIYPKERMTFPYEDVTAKLIVVCSKREEWVELHFSSNVNLAHDENYDGYSRSVSNIRWGDRLEEIAFIQYAHSSKLRVEDGPTVVKKILSNNLVIIEQQWHGQDKIYLSFDLNGSNEAIKQIQLACWRDT